ncbi:glycerophosphodiester phosphodiesterase [Brevundimonas subvibrioides]|uniref:glycerophosphodiester phosphodiesterase n=1 Tax=Brevundimonas subvibrioides TaxID=74313 RepID=UPI0022B52D32|nr:glycerophosphodiester phosphodiesterase [Brevundimonas subvibrioides]
MSLFAALAAGLTLIQVIAHRGASGERPEHTRAAYELAIDQGADVIEPDLVMSRDGALVVRHENEISGTTDVADHPEFAARRTTRTIDGVATTGWFTEDFTLAELRTLRARERLPDLRPGNTAFVDEPILTFQQVIDIARAGSARTGRVIGVAPELKHPTYFASLGLPMEPPFIEALRTNALMAADSPVLIQCFEVETLRSLDQSTDAPLLQLMSNEGGPADQPGMTYAAMVTPGGLAEIATYADAIGVDTAMIVPRDASGVTTTPTPLIEDAHAAGLKVVAWTFRAEDPFLPTDYRGDLPAWLRRFYGLGIDAVFSDFPGVAVRARTHPLP